MQRNALDKPVLIAGGGIGGLAAALALASRGVPCRVLERRPVFAEEGAGIQIGPNGMRVLENLGAAEHLRPQAAAPDALEVHDATTGATLAVLPLGEWIGQRHGAPYWTAHRQDLHQSLLTAAHSRNDIEITTSADAVLAQSRNEEVVVRLGDDCELSGSALIVADGVRSHLRKQIFGGSDPTYAGKCAFRAVVPHSMAPREVAANVVHIWLGRGAHVVNYPVRGGAEIAIVVIFDDAKISDGWSLAVESSAVAERVKSFAKPIRDLVEAAPHWRMWSLVELSMPPRWNAERIVLLGDAAHPVLPFVAQGAVLALEDAITFADLLERTQGDVVKAGRHYGECRRPRALRVQAASRRNGRHYHLDGLFARARNSVLRLTPPAVLMAQFDWLYGWTIERSRVPVLRD